MAHLQGELGVISLSSHFTRSIFSDLGKSMTYMCCLKSDALNLLLLGDVDALATTLVPSAFGMP